MSAFIPEIHIYNNTKAVIKLLREDYKNIVNKEESYLFKFFGRDSHTNSPLFFQDFDWFKESVALLVDSEITQNNLEICLGYNLNRASSPTVHIMMPQESPKGSPVGSNEGYSEGFEDENGIYHTGYTFGTSVVYNLLITSQNASQVIIIYQMLKQGFNALIHDFEFKGFQNLNIGGSDIQFDDSMIPANIFHRNLTLSFDYDYQTFDLVGREIGKNLVFPMEKRDQL